MEKTSPNVPFTRAEDLGTDVVDIIVGPKRKRFVVHKQLLTSQSTYFKNTLREPNMVNENKIYFDDEDPAAVALFVGWLYRGSIPEVAAMEKKIRYSIPPGSSVPPESTLNGNTAPGKVPHIMNGQASPKLPATPTLPATSKPAVQTFMSPSTTSLSPLGKISQTPTPVFGHPRQNTSNALPPASLPNASATPNPASSRDPEREALQLALLHLCLFTAKPQWPDPFNLAIESYCRIVAARVIPPRSSRARLQIHYASRLAATRIYH
ncbi:hypothetical protein ACMFMF_008404 [Clarireedia jacksonii]